MWIHRWAGSRPGLIKAALERGLQAELSEHLGHKRASLQARMYETPATGSPRKRVASEIADIQLDVPRDRVGSFAPRLGGLDDMIISLYAAAASNNQVCAPAPIPRNSASAALRALIV